MGNIEKNRKRNGLGKFRVGLSPWFRYLYTHTHTHTHLMCILISKVKQVEYITVYFRYKYWSRNINSVIFFMIEKLLLCWARRPFACCFKTIIKIPGDLVEGKYEIYFFLLNFLSILKEIFFFFTVNTYCNISHLLSDQVRRYLISSKFETHPSVVTMVQFYILGQLTKPALEFLS